MKTKILVLISFLSVFNLLNAQNIEHFLINFNVNTQKDNVADWKLMLSISDEISVLPAKIQHPKLDALGWNHIDYTLSYKNIPIEYAIIKSHWNNNQIQSINGEYFKNVNVNVNPVLSENDALTKALNKINATEYIWQKSRDPMTGDMNQYFNKPPKGELVICKNYINKEDNNLHLAYKFKIFAVNPHSSNYVYVDANNGEVIHVNSLIYDVDGTAATRYSGNRTISTIQPYLHNYYKLLDTSRGAIGQGIITENYNATCDNYGYSNITEFTDADNNWTAAEFHNANKDDAALDAHWGLEMTYDYFKNVHNRDSYDDSGAIIHAYVHFCYPTNGNGLGKINNINASWQWGWTSGYMTFGDGDTLGYEPVVSLDVTGHELGHAYTFHMVGGLLSSGEPAALNEGISDCWGASVEYHTDPTKDTWRIGENFMGTSGKIAERSLSNPKDGPLFQNFLFPDTYHRTNWSCVDEPHANSTILSHWFYLLSVGGPGTNDFNYSYNVTGITIAEAEKILFKAVDHYMTPNTDYITMRGLTIQAATDIYGPSSQEVTSATNAWEAVGVTDSLLTNTIVSGTTRTWYFPTNLSANNTIQTNTNITYIAGHQIILLPGFNTILGAIFHAYVDNCANVEGY